MLLQKKVIFLIDAIKPNIEKKKYAQIRIQNLRKRQNTIIIENIVTKKMQNYLYVYFKVFLKYSIKNDFRYTKSIMLDLTSI